MEVILSVVMLLLGIALGAVGVWLVDRAKLRQAETAARSAVGAEMAALSERLSAREQTIAQLRDETQQLLDQLQQRQAAETALREKVSQLGATLVQEKKQAEEKLAVLNEAQQKLSDAFKALAGEALKSNNQQFLQLAKATLESFQEAARGDLEKRQQAIDGLVKPVRESLEKVDTKIQALEKAREGAYQGLREQVQSLLQFGQDLRQETSKLAQALRRPQVRGRWGETRAACAPTWWSICRPRSRSWWMPRRRWPPISKPSKHPTSPPGARCSKSMPDTYANTSATWGARPISNRSRPRPSLWCSSCRARCSLVPHWRLIPG